MITFFYRWCILLFFLLGFVSQGCKKKFIHESPELDLTCECCSKTEAFEGTYKGTLFYQKFPPDINHVDYEIVEEVIEVTLTRTYENLNPFEDSLVCAFEINYFFDEPIKFTSKSLLNNSFFPKEYTVQTIIDDTLKIVEMGRIRSTHSYITWKKREFVGIKI